MIFKNCSKLGLVMVALAFVSPFGMNVEAQMGQPDTVSLKGTLIDLTCAAKGNAMMNSWGNTKQDHMMADGNVMKSCATMCLQGGQPAALFAGNQITAVLACNPRNTLAQYAAQDVEVQGFWAGSGSDVKPFVPIKIRTGSGSWQEVDCANMH
ncbi:MAG: hypothetical protein E2P05_04515 [Acidobacteria bacterium]|nr:MAG: hypothetical protein E2P05_04515 [Acidobacteriota bacterium]